MKNILFNLSCFLLLSSVLFSCQKDPLPTPDTTNYIKVTEAVSTGSSFNVGFYATDSLFVGYNKVHLKVTDKTTGLAINQATIVLHPLMDMVTMKHACPLENPASTPNTSGYYVGAVIFSMPGTNSWSLSADVTANGKTETVNFAIPKVIATTPVQKIVVIDTVMTAGVMTFIKYPVSIVKPTAWKVGMNPFEITIHNMKSMMEFPPCDDFTVVITPEMPSMGHGSPNNVNPVYVTNGHYVGTVNFTMTGAWRINMLIKKSGWAKAKNAYFDISF